MEEECTFVLQTGGEKERMCGFQMGLQCRRYKWWWSGNQEGHGGVGERVIEELYDKVVEVRRVNDRVMEPAIVFEDVVRVA